MGKQRVFLCWFLYSMGNLRSICVCYAGGEVENKPPPTDRTLAEIFTSLQRSKLGLQDWSLSDITVGLYLIYLRQASTNAVEDLKGELISSESTVIIETILF